MTPKTETYKIKELENSSYLIQRLKKPFKETPNSLNTALLSALSFGGGLKNGGLSDEAMSLISPLMRFDYMGSAEFEWGAIPNFFKNIAKKISTYTAWQLEVNKHKVYVVGETELMEAINYRIGQIADPYKHKLFFKESPQFNIAVNNAASCVPIETDTVGWLELDNEFMFFVDEQMFNGVVNLFNIQTNN